MNFFVSCFTLYKCRYCPTCKEHRQATKKLDLWRLPEILVFHLKRFSYSRYLKNKLDTFVNFPVHDLDLSKYVKSKDSPPQSHLYELYAMSNHYGGLGGGHYSAYAKVRIVILNKLHSNTKMVFIPQCFRTHFSLKFGQYQKFWCFPN